MTDDKSKQELARLLMETEHQKEIEQAKKEALKNLFPTHDEAIDTILALRAENQKLKQDLARATHKRPRGRPRKNFKNSKSALVRALSGAMNKPPKKGGRPRKTTLEEMKRKLSVIDGAKAMVAKEEKRKSVTDKFFSDYAIDRVKETKSLRSDKRKEKAREFLAQIKYWRDETGIRQKRKTPPKKV